ncbi:MAG: ABC transporter ATP-binding protein [Clostridia bacterium]|nr:ABC transporter ATP-binding protein [Clostridia bacterium]
MIELRNISKNYGNFFALSGVSLQIEDGEFVAVVGESGSGKSTLLNLIGQIDTPSDGEIIINGKTATKLPEKEVAAMRNKTFGFVFQSFFLEPTYTVTQNVEIPLLLAGVKKSARAERVSAALQKVGLTEKANNKASDLSGGEQQRVAIARAIVNDPPVIIADEPCGNLDTKNGDGVMQLLKELNGEGKTVLMVTHSAEHAKWAKRIIKLCDGKVLYDEGSNV